MADPFAVVPDLMVCDSCHYRHRFPLPGPGRIAVNVGDQVTPTDVIGFVVERGPVVLVDVSGGIGVPARRMSEFLTVKEGQSVRAGEILAQRKGMLFSRQVAAPADGRAMVIGAGMILMEAFPTERPIRGCLPGRVAEVTPGESIEVEGGGGMVVLTSVVSSDFNGPLKVASPVPERVLRPEHIDATAHGAVLVAGIVEDLAALERAAEFGAKGMIVASIPASLLSKKLPVPIAVTEGFGHLPMNRPAFDLFNTLAGRLAFVLRRGRRGWVICPDKEFADGVEFNGTGLARLKTGDWIRVAAGPKTGQVGRVQEYLAGQGDVIVKVGGQRVALPVANCEMVVRSENKSDA